MKKRTFGSVILLLGHFYKSRQISPLPSNPYFLMAFG
jgi:hypothetical protein